MENNDLITHLSQATKDWVSTTMVELGWAQQNTGGGCTAWVKQIHRGAYYDGVGAYLMATGDDGTCAVPELGDVEDGVMIGLYVNGDEEHIEDSVPWSVESINEAEGRLRARLAKKPATV